MARCTPASQPTCGNAAWITAKAASQDVGLVEQHDDINEAIKRETRIKGWKRACKLALIEEDNPQWLDLYESLLLPRHLRKDPDE